VVGRCLKGVEVGENRVGRWGLLIVNRVRAKNGKETTSETREEERLGGRKSGGGARGEDADLGIRSREWVEDPNPDAEVRRLL